MFISFFLKIEYCYLWINLQHPKKALIKLKWKIAGPEKNILSNDGYLMEKSILNANDDTLKLKEKKFTGIRQRLGNLLEFSYRKKA